MTKANETGAYVGKTDYPLSQQGREEISKLKNSSCFPNIDAVYVSPSCRCIQTANMIYTDFKPVVIAKLSEYDFGEWEGKTASELKDDKVFAAWIRGEKGACPPNGENAFDFHSRIVNTFSSILDGIIEAGLHDCALVTHAGIISTLLSVYGIPQASSVNWPVKPGQGYSVRMTTQMWMRDHKFEIYDRLPLSSVKNI